MYKLKHVLKHSKTISPQTLPENSDLLKLSKLTAKKLLAQFKTGISSGLDTKEVKKRRRLFGANEISKERRRRWPTILFNNIRDPLSILLLILIAVSFITKDIKAVALISAMLLLSIILRFVQEIKADTAAKKLRALIHTTVKVTRNRKIINVPLNCIVPGDIIHLSAGDMIPADVILLESKDLFVNQATITGESLPSEKHASSTKITNNIFESENICFLGNNVESGSAIALAIKTGRQTYLGSIAKEITDKEDPTSFDIGIKKFTWMFMTIIIVMVPLVFLINGLARGNWFEAILFALAVAVGLAPEMMPMIVAVNLSKGALDMSKKKVIVKHLNSVQNFGAMDILCTDKTGTITEGKVILEKYLNIHGEPDDKVLDYAFLNSYYQTGLNNLMDAAILKHNEVKSALKPEKNYKKMDEIPFDFSRRRMSVVVETPEHKHLLICKGAIEEITKNCLKVELKKDIEGQLNVGGFRVMAIAYKYISNAQKRYTINDETDMILAGFLAFLDPPKASAREAIESLEQNGITIKVLTGDNAIVTKNICAQVGLETKKIILGEEIENTNETELLRLVSTTNIFAKLTPLHKERIIKALRQSGHAVGFMGDGINDAPALRAADIGISVNSAADIAKESSDIILLEQSLLVLRDGVLEGRKIFGNVVKYIQMAASSNFGNMFSILGASIFLPFLPMLPIQILANNMLYDISQTTIPTDQVDADFLAKPRQWEIGKMKKFILFIGPVSSLFDFATFFLMIFIFNSWDNPSLFQTGWFVESLISQTLIIYIIRTNKIPFLQSWPSKTLLLTTLLIAGIGIYLPYSFLASALRFTPLPLAYWIWLAGFIMAYFLLTQIIKMWFVKRYGE